MTLTKENKMMVAGHQGDCYNCFANTMSAFKAAIEAGADMIETDVHITKDGKLILMHDDTVDRTTDGTGAIADKTYEELCRLNAGGKYAPEKIPTLEELLILLKETKVTLNLEIKEYYSEENPASADKCHKCIDLCVEMIEKYDFADQMLFNSADAHVLEYIDEKYNGKYLLHGFYPYSIMRNVKRNPDEYLYCACVYQDRDPKNYEYLLERGIEPWIGAGVTRKAHLQECFELGARLITTNFPADCIRKLEEIGAR